MSKMRLQRMIAKSGYTSRRKAEVLIANGNVKVNGQVITELGTQVSNKDIIHVNGELISKEEKVYYVIYKPKECLSSVSDDRGRPCVVDLVDDERRIYPVGRLDYDTTGMLFLTNDGEFANQMTHPRYEVTKVYDVVVVGHMSKEIQRKLETGILLDGSKTLPTKIKVQQRDKEKNMTNFEITIREGRNRQIKRMMEEMGLEVVRLHRKQIAHISLGPLQPGQYRHLKPYEIKTLIKYAETGEQ